MGSHKKSRKYKKDKPRNSKRRSHKNKKEDSIPTNVLKHDKSTQSVSEPHCSSVVGSGKLCDPNSKNETSMVDNKINKCDSNDDSKNDLNNLDDSIKIDERNREIKGFKHDNRSIKSVSEDKKTEMEVPESASKYKRVSSTKGSNNLTTDADSDIVKVENSMSRKFSISDAVVGKSQKNCFNKGSENKDLNLPAKPSRVNPVEGTNSTSTKVTAYSMQQTQGSEEEKPIKPESFLPKETMRIKRKKPKVATIKKRRNTIVFPHICADDDDVQVSIPTSKMKADIETHEDGEISSSSSEFHDEYDENLMGDELDCERLNKLSEIDRELEIYKRCEEREINKRRWEIKRKLKKNANKLTETSGRSLKRKEELEKVHAKNERSTAMAALVKQRERKYNNALEQCTTDNKSIPDEVCEISPKIAKRRKSTVKLKASDIYSDESCSDDDNIIEIQPPIPVMSNSIKTVQELNQIFISRTNMEKLLYLPDFKETVLNSFVRFKSGSSIEQCIYYVAEIIGFQKCAVYTLGETISNTHLLLKNATNELTLSMEYISNDQIKEVDFKKWLNDCKTRKVPLPKREDVKNKMQEIRKALEYNVTDTDINNMVEKKTALRQCPRNVALEKACLLKDRNSATHNGDLDHVVFLNQKIKELEELNGNRDRIVARRHTIMYTSSPFSIPRPVHNLYQEGAVNPYDPYTRRPTRPHKVVTSVGNKDNAKFLIPPPPSYK